MKNLLLISRIELLSSFRSPIWHRKILINLFLVLTFLYLAGNFLVLGIFLDDLLIKIPVDGIDYNAYGPSFVVRKLNQFLLYYFFIDLIMRYFMQKLPAMAIQPLLHLPLKKSTLVHFMLLKTVWSPFNWFQFLIFVPFFFEVFQNLPFDVALGWTSGFTAFVYLINYGLLYLKRTSDVDTKVYLGMLVALVLLISADWYDFIDFKWLSGQVFDALLLQPVLSLLILGATFFMYYLNFNYLKNNMYLNKLSKQKRSEVSYVGSGILSSFGLVGRLTELEFKFIWRNKRPKSVLMITILFLAYGLLVFPNPQYQGNYFMYILFSIIITGMFLMNYGQYLLGWEGTHFDHILSRNVSFYDYYMSKFLLFALVSGGAMILSIPYAYFGWDVLLIVFSVFLFNLGINSHIVMFFGSMNPKKIDLSQGTVFNWQGVGAAQFLLVLPVLGLPLGIYALGALILGDDRGFLALALIGIAGLAGTKYWIKLLAMWLKKQRYEIADDFRNQ